MFNFGGNKVKSITISPSNQYVIWEEKLEDLAKDCDLIVSPGCVGLYIVNGALKSVNTPGKWVINSKDEVRDKSNLTLIAVNNDKIFEIYCGTGNIPFHDEETELDGTIGAFGNCNLRIIHAWSLYTSFGHAPITAKEIDEFAKSKLIEIMTSHLSAAANKYYYQDINSKQSIISDEMKKQFSKVLINIGLEVESFSLRGITFGADYVEKRKEHLENKHKRKIDNDQRRINAAIQSDEVNNIVNILNATPAASTPAPTPVTPPPAAPARPDNNVQYCPQCGVKLPASAKFCQECGKPL